MRPLQTLCVLCVVLVGAGCASLGDPPGQTGTQHENELLAAGDSKVEVEYFLYSIRPGDSLYRLERRFKVPWREIAETNSVDPAALRVNQTLLIRQVEGVEPEELSLDERYAIDIPEGQVTSLHVSAKLLYRKADQFLLNFLFGEDSGLTAPITMLSEDEKTIVVRSTD